MAENDYLLLTQLHFYSRIGQYERVTSLCETNIIKYTNDALLQLYAACAHLRLGSTQEAIRSFDSCASHKELSLAANYGTLQAHQLADTTDSEATNEIEAKISAAESSSDAQLHYYAAFALHLIGQHDKAKEHVTKTLKQSSQHSLALCLNGWLQLQIDTDIKHAKLSFDQALNFAPSNQYLDPWFGLCRYHELRQNRNGMNEALNRASSTVPNFLPINIERMKYHLMGKDWDHCADVASRCELMDSTCVDAVCCVALNALCNEGNVQEADNALHQLTQCIETAECSNALIRLNMASLFSRLCARKQEILAYTKAMLDRALSVRASADIHIELGRHLRMMGQLKGALKAYTTAMHLPQTDNGPMLLLGIVHCHLLDNELNEAQAQLELVKAAHSDMEQSVTLRYMEAILGKLTGKPRQEVCEQLIAVVDQHFTRLQTVPYGIQYLLQLDPDFVLELVNHLFVYVPIEPVKAPQQPDPVLRDIQRILSAVVDAVPGLVDGLYLLAKAKYLSADNEAAQQILSKCLEKDQTFSEGHLLMAQIYLQKNNFKMASQSLDVGLSYNFQVRDHPLYHLIKARVQKRSNNIQAALQQLNTAVTLPLFKQASSGAKEMSKNKLALTEPDRVAIYLELIDCYQALERTEEASKWMTEAMRVFKGTQEEENLLLCNADLAVARGDADGALVMLDAVTSDQPIFVLTRQKIAEIYLHHKKDKRQFAICYKELVDKNPTPQAFVLLGDAYMSIQEPERAIEVYEAALKRNPKDHELARKIGAAYVQAHLYSKAVAYYEAALKTGQQNFLRHDLADLLFRLQNYEKCEKVLVQGLDKQAAAVDVASMIDEVKLLALLAKLFTQTERATEANEKLLHAKEQQTRILKRPTSEVPDVPAQKALAAKLCCELGKIAENQRQLTTAIQYYKEALGYTETDVKIMLSVAHLYLLCGEVDECNQQCQVMLRIDKDNDAATLLLADLMYQRNETDNAMYHFQHLLDRNPNQYHALARMVELSWRTGDLDQAERYLKVAAERNSRATLEPGYNFCKALLDWFTGDPNAALQHFNRARRDVEWGERAIYNMVEICLNPDNEIIGGEVFERGEAADNSNSDWQDQREVGVRTAEKFLKELRFKPGLHFKYRLMESFIKLASKNKANIDQAVVEFTDMNEDESSERVASVGAVLGLARAYMIMKQQPRAKVQLKRIVNHPWNLDDADYMEQCWLLLADMYIHTNKYDQAQDVLKLCMQRNASCIKAFEFIGFIKEKENKWLEATANYDQAYKIGKRRNPTIGYKLAYNQLKARRLVDAIDTCHQVLDSHPNYPKIRREVLDKARASLRM